MRALVLVLACLTCISHGRRVHASSFSALRSGKDQRLAISKADAEAGLVKQPKALAALLLASSNPAAAWQTIGHGRNPLRTFQRLAAAIPMQETEGAVAQKGAAAGKFDFLAVEKKWQDYWDREDTFKTERRPGHPKKYVLDMFPYPSGAGLHVGHPEGYTATDIMSRYWRMKDFDVLHPMGWDAFGLPAEQHAINTGTHPSKTTYENIANFKRQLKSLGFSYDWSRELATTDDDCRQLQFFHGIYTTKDLGTSKPCSVT